MHEKSPSLVMLNFIFILQKVRAGLGDLMDSWTPCMNLIGEQINRAGERTITLQYRRY